MRTFHVGQQKDGRTRIAPLRLSGAAIVAMGMLVALGLPGSATPEPTRQFVAGTQPDRRPAGAPVLREMEKGPEWYERALRGISEPFPASLRFLEDQGAWYTPFIHPGMTGRYDIRGLHAGSRVGDTR